MRFHKLEGESKTIIDLDKIVSIEWTSTTGRYGDFFDIIFDNHKIRIGKDDYKKIKMIFGIAEGE